MKKFLFFLLLSAHAYADCRVQDILPTIRPGAEWTIPAGSQNFVWRSTQTAPTIAEIQTAITACQASAITRASQKLQARQDVKNTSLTPAQRIQALLILLDFDQ